MADGMSGLEASREYSGYKFYIEGVASNLPETMQMWEDHWHEQREEDLRGQAFNPAVGYFQELEKKHDFAYITVRKGKELVGHFGLQFGLNRQTSLRVAGDDFFYLKPDHRKGMLGVKLIKFARDFAFYLGAKEFSVSYRVTVPDLDVVLRRCGMTKIANVYNIRKEAREDEHI